MLHNHQPVGNFGWVVEDNWRRAYEPMLAALERHPAIDVGLHYSGPLVEWLRANHPGALDRIAGLVARGQVELLGGAWYEPILAALPVADRIEQLVRMADEVEAWCGVRPRGAWLAERVWEPSIAFDLAQAGYAYTILDDEHLRASAVPDDQMWGTYTVDDQGRMVIVFATERGLRYTIPWRPAEEVIEHLRGHATADGRRVGMMGDDGEKFGGWPGTYEWCWGEGGWVERAFTDIESNSAWLMMVRPSEWIDANAPVGRVAIPTASYIEMSEWALPPADSVRFHRLLQQARDADDPSLRFLRGGTWRAFQSRYREANELHKQMLRASALVHAMPSGPERQRALEHLHRGQSNDAYWHGLFGGIYLPDLRVATLHELIIAEDVATSGTVPTQVADHDLDGIAEVLLGGPGQTVMVDLAEGGAISSWDLLAPGVPLLSVMRRRPEAAHLRLQEASVAVSDAQDATSPHEAVVVKEEGLEHLLDYDRHERRGALVHLLDRQQAESLGPDELAREDFEDVAEVCEAPYRLTSSAPAVARRLEVRRDAAQVAVTKRITLGGSRLAPELDVEVEVSTSMPGAAELELDLEWAFGLLGGGGNPQAWYESTDPASGRLVRSSHDGKEDLRAVSLLAFGNDHLGIRVDASFRPAARVTWYPVETVSSSEAGTERVYQGSSLHMRWPVAPTMEHSANAAVHFLVTIRAER